MSRDLMNEAQVQEGFFQMESFLARCRLQAIEALGGARSGERFVHPRDRAWATELPLSERLLSGIQGAKERPGGQGMHHKGVSLMKDPFDLALLPMLLWELRPRTVIELGACAGGSALWLADQLLSMGLQAEILSLDLDLGLLGVQDPRICFLQADFTDLPSLGRAGLGPERLALLPHPWLVLEDAHVNVYELLTWLNVFMKPGDYLVAEDLLDREKHDEVRRFAVDRAYLVDTRYTDLFGYNMTWNVNGYLRKEVR